MITGNSFLAIIPARGGSKRLPRKNILKLAGKPLIAWTIEAALNVKYFDEIIVSTDDKKIAEISRNYGAIIPFLRPAHLATDTIKTVDVVVSVINYYKEKQNRVFDCIVVLQPTSPLRDTEDIENAIELFMREKANAVISVCETEHPPLWANTLPENLSMNNFLKDEIINVRSQDLETYYRINGAVYIIRTDILLKEQRFFPEEKSYAYVMRQNKSIDIDTETDFNLAEILINKKKDL